MARHRRQGYELAATRLLNRGRKLSSADSEQHAQAELLIAAANAFALLDLASAIRDQQAGSETASDESADIDEGTAEVDDAPESEGDAAQVADEPAES